MREAVRDAVAAGTLDVEVPDQVTVERPKTRDHGDYATNVALRLAKPARQPPRDVAEAIAGHLRRHDGVSAVDIAGPGFLNITLDAGAQGQLVATIVTAGDHYGHTEALTGQRINLEFVSANPTGPVHLGGVRWAAVGDSLARLLEASGAEVTREYYFNDHGAQIDRFARSLLAVARGREVPEDGYGGDYIHDIAAQITAADPGVGALADDEAHEVFRREGVELMFAEIKTDLSAFGVHFDVYFHEQSLHDSGRVQQAITRLDEAGRLYHKDGALWLRSTDFGDDKDRVVIKSDGEPAYIAGDLAYYLDKRERGFDRCLIMLGADHHGYVGRLMAMCAAFGDEPTVNLQVLIGQYVRLLRDGQPLRMSKRAGTVISLVDLVDAIGVDAGRYALARSSSDVMIDIDLDVWSRRTNDNPVFYVQYAHARIASLLRNAVDLGVDRGAVADADLALLSTEREGDLLGSLAQFPAVVTAAAELRAPHRVARYLEELAGTYHRFYDDCRILPRGDDDLTPQAVPRLWLCEATRSVLANGLGLLGVSAPDRM